jgi:hypothetical protein
MPTSSSGSSGGGGGAGGSSRPKMLPSATPFGQQAHQLQQHPQLFPGAAAGPTTSGSGSGTGGAATTAATGLLFERGLSLPAALVLGAGGDPQAATAATSSHIR